MGLIKAGIQAGTAYVIANKMAQAQQRVTPHPPCNCPHCPYSEAFNNYNAPQSSSPPAPYGNAPQPPMPHAPYGGSSRREGKSRSPLNAVYVVHQHHTQPQPGPVERYHQPERAETYPAPPSYDSSHSSNSAYDFVRDDEKRVSNGQSGGDRKIGW